ncbi:DUF4435 domain-containing protein [Aquincola sp. S2]|uniref:DUF4435 domain-containing protein n=1 Tax=Pseudaquabacterium terrae TaxID=2732868 RepID=A0ABX2ES46_9BURK|nr:DUF4435 domain-containing protein [Aquabacterium terrae]
MGPSRLIFALEGREDIPIYDIWLARELGEEIAEPLDVKGKGNVLELSRLISLSESAEKDKVMLCVDHDFDGTRGSSIPANTYVTSAYSIENLLVSEACIDRLLIRAFNAAGAEQEVRRSIVERFARLLGEFNGAMLHPNAHARFARLSKIECPGFPDRIEPIIDVTLDAVRAKVDTTNTQECVQYLRLSASPLPSVLHEHVEFLRQSNLTSTGRGKFLLDFVRKFLAQVFEDRRAVNPRLFKESNKSLPDPCHNLLVNLANASPTASCFRKFVQEQVTRWRADGLAAPGTL